MTTKIMQRLAGKVSVLIMVALLIAAVGTYGLSNSKHDNPGRATAAVSPSKVESAPAASPAAQQAKASAVKDVSVSVRTVSTTSSAPVPGASPTVAASAPPAADASASTHSVVMTLPIPVVQKPTVTPASAEMAKAQVAPLDNARAAFGQLPLMFIPNQGQFDKGVEYEARGASYITSLTSDAAYVGLHRNGAKGEPGKQALVRLGFAGAKPLHFQASEQQATYGNYIGLPKTVTHVPTYGRLTASEVYPGIDATFYGNQSNLQFDFMVKPGADPKSIHLKVAGGPVTLDENGDLTVTTELGAVHQRKPVLYQEANGVRQPVEGGYKVDGDTVTFEVGAYDPTRTLTIDPVIFFSLVIGGGQAGPPPFGDTTINAVAEDAGAVYVAGTTNVNAINLSGTNSMPGVSNNSYNHVLVVSLPRTGVNPGANWYTILSGNLNDLGLGIAVEDPTLNSITATTPSCNGATGYPNGQCGIYVVGQTFSSNFSINVTPPAANTYQGAGDGFIVRLSGQGIALAGPVFIGGTGADSATSVAVRCASTAPANAGCQNHDRQNDVYIGMWTQSPSITSIPALQLQGGGFSSGLQAGAIVDLRATDLTAPVSNKGTIRYFNASESASINALALLPFPTTTAGVLQQATQVAFAGQISTPGGLSPIVNPVQACAGGNNCYGGGASDGIWGVTNTEITPTDPSVALSDVFNSDYAGGAGNDNLTGAAILPDGRLVVAGYTNGTAGMPFTTPNVLTSNNPPVQNYSCGNPPADNMSGCGGAEDVVAVIISPGGIGAAATANVGQTAAGAVTLGTPAVLTVNYGTPGAANPAAAGVAATSTVTAGVAATATATVGVQGTLMLTAGVTATAVPTMSLVVAGTVTAVTITNPGTEDGYWAEPQVTFVPPGVGCTILPTGWASIDGMGHVNAINVLNAGECAGIPTITIQPPGIQALTINVPGNGYQSTASPNTPSSLNVTFNGVTCTTGPGATSPSATITLTNGNPVSTPYPTITGNGTNASLNTVNIAAPSAVTNSPINAGTPGGFGLGCTFAAPTATVPAPGLQSLIVNNSPANDGYQGGSQITITASAGGTCTGFAATFNVSGNSPDQDIPNDNILTNSGSGCGLTAPTVTLTPPGIAAAALGAGGTGYCSGAPCSSVAHTYLVTFNGTCATPPQATVTVNNSFGNVTQETLVNSGTNCTVQPTTELIDAGGITAITVNTPGSGYPANSSFAVTVAAPTGPSGVGSSAGDNLQTAGANPFSHCNDTAQATAFTGNTGAITSFVITDPGCGYVTGVNPAVTVPGPGLTVTGTGGTGYTAPVSITFGNTALNCTTPPTSPLAVTIGAGGTISLPINNIAANCVGGHGAITATPSVTPGVTSIATTTSGNSYNVPPTLTFTNCTVQPQATVTLAGPPPNGITNTYNITSFGTCTGGATVVYSPPGLVSPPGTMPPAVGEPFTITNPGVGYTSTPTVQVVGCNNTPAVAATACIAGIANPNCPPLSGPATAGTLASINLNSATSGGNNCGGNGPQAACPGNAPLCVLLTGGTAPGFAALDYIGGAGSDTASSVTTDPNANIYIAGTTNSSNFPVVTNPAWTGLSTLPGTQAGFVSRITEIGGIVNNTNNGGGFSTYFGGSNGVNTFNAVVIDNLLNLYVAGQTYASNFPIVGGAPAFQGDSDGTVTNLTFNNMVITTAPAPGTPTTSASFVEGIDGTAPVPGSQSFLVVCPNGTCPFSVAGGAVGGVPGSSVTYSSNSGASQWLSITASAGGFTLTINTSNMPPDNYSASFIVSAPSSDTPPVVFTVHLSITGTFQTYNCSGATCITSSLFTFVYTKAENNVGTVTPAQQLLVGILGVPLTPTPYYPPNGFTATINYNTNPTLQVFTGIGTASGGLGNTTTGANNGNFQWFTMAGVSCAGSGASTSCTGSGLQFGSNIALTIVPSVLDTLAESGVAGSNVAQGSITFTEPNPGGGGLTSITIQVQAAVTPRLAFTNVSDASPAPGDPTSLPGVGFAFSCTGGTPSPTTCTSINPSVTNHFFMRGWYDVIQIIAGPGNADIRPGNTPGMAAVTLTSVPTGVTAANALANCFTIGVPPGSYQAPSSGDTTATDLSLPVTVNINSGNASCVQGVYQGNLTITASHLAAVPTDAIATLGTGFNALGPNDTPAANPAETVGGGGAVFGELTVPITITLGNELYLTTTSSFNFGNLVLNAQEGLEGAVTGQNPDNPTGNTLSVLPANQTGTVSLTLPPSTYSTNFEVTCNVNPTFNYTPVTSTASSTSSVTCDWLTAAISGSNLASGGPTTQTLTVGLTSSGTNNITSLATNGVTPETYTGSIVLTYLSGTLAGSSYAYPVTINLAHQPLNWNTTAGGTPPAITVVTTVGAGNVGYVNGAATTTSLNSIPCGSVYSTAAEYTASNPQAFKVNVLAVGNQTFATSGPTLSGSGAGANANAGWLTVTEGAVAGAGVSGSGDPLTCGISILNLAPGTYTGCYDAISTANAGPTPASSNAVPAGTTAGATSCSTAWPLFPAPGTSGAPPANTIGRTVGSIVLTVNAAPTLTSLPTTIGFSYETGNPAPANQTITLCDGTSLTTGGVCSGGTASIQNVFATSSVNANPYTTATGSSWISITGAATGAGGTTLAANATTTLTLSIAAGALSGANALPTGTFNGLITLSCASCTLAPASIPFSLTVVSQPVLSTVPGTLDQFTYQIGEPTTNPTNPPSENLAVVLSSLPVPSGTPTCTASPATVTGCYSVVAASAANWLSVTGAANTPLVGTLSSTSLGFQVNANPAPGGTPLAPSTIPYTGTVTITVPTALNSPITLNVSFLVNPQPTLNVTTPNGFAYTVGGTPPSSQTLTFAAANPGSSSGAVLSAGFTASLGGCASPAGGPADPFTLALANGSPGTSVSAIAGNIGVTQTQVTLAANVGTITSAMAGVYSCTLTVTSPGTSGGPPASNASQTFPVVLTVSTQPIITISGCTGSTFNYTLTNAGPTPATITCTVSDSDPSIPISNLSVNSGCPGSWLSCNVAPATIGGTGNPTTATLTLTPTNLADQNPGTFPASGGTNIILAGNIPVTGTPPTCTAANSATTVGCAIPNSPGVAVTQINTPLITVNPTGTLTYGGTAGYTQGSLTPPPSQTVSAVLHEGTGGTPAGPGNPGTGVVITSVDSSSFATGSCGLAAGATGSTITSGPINWLSVTQSPVLAAGAGSTSTTYTLTISVNTGVFPTLTASTTCTGKIDVNSSGVTPAAAQQQIPVTFTINPQSGLSASANGMTISPGGNFPVPFTVVSGYPVSLTSTATPVPVTVTTSPTPGQQYTVTIQSVTGGNWLTSSGCTISNPCTANASTPGFSLGVAAGVTAPPPAGLSPTSYSATVSIAPAGSSSSPTNTLTFVVTLNVDTEAVLSATQSGSLGGPYFPNTSGTAPFFTTPGTLTLNVATASPSSGAPATPSQFTVTQTALTGSTPSNLLIINGTQPYTTTGTSTTVPVTITYSAAVANTLALSAPGTYGGTLTVQVTQSGVTTNPQSIQIPWSITIEPEAQILTSPSSVQGVVVNCVIDTICSTGIPTISVAAISNSLNVPIPVSVSSAALPIPWLTATPTTGTANSLTLSLSVNTNGLQANTSYAGQVAVTSPDASNSGYTVPVTLNVLPPPTCTFTASNLSLPSTGTATPVTVGGATGGVQPEVPVAVSLGSLSSSCAGGTFSVSVSGVTTSVQWLSATGGASGVMVTALSNPHGSAISGTLTITNSNSAAGYSQTVTVTEAANTAPEYPTREITALYQVILGRDADSGGFTYWAASGLPLGTMGDDFFTSPEAFNSDFAVIAAFQAANNAPPLFTQFGPAVASVRAGGQTALTSLFNSLVASSPTANYSATTLYTNLLNRAPTSTESSNCTSIGLPACFMAIIGYPAPANVSPVAATANEFQSTCGTSACVGVGGATHAATGDHTNGLYITMLYLTILTRNPDTGGYAYWLGIANAGGPGILFQGSAGYPTRIVILGNGTQGEGFIYSPEFEADYQ